MDSMKIGTQGLISLHCWGGQAYFEGAGATPLDTPLYGIEKSYNF